jgi:hypothetical protein
MEKAIAQVDTDIFAQYEGKYRYVDYPDFGAEITKDGEHIFLQESPIGLRFQLFPESETDFFCLERSEKITLIENDSGKIEGMKIGENDYLERVE